MGNERQIIRIQGGTATTRVRSVVEEYPLRLRVNGRELLTLVASPHQLPVLVTGFLRLQGLIAVAGDILALGICSDAGLASVVIRAPLPPVLPTVVTSGCGGGVVFHALDALPPVPASARPIPAASVVALMRAMQERAERYASHGGIHAAAVGDGAGVLLHAEDLGRHNTIDRIAGAALLAGRTLEGCLLVTSGRVSAEMLVKAARLGIVLVASHTAPTSLAIAAAQQAGITLVGYLRGENFEIYTHASRLAVAPAPEEDEACP